MWLDGEESNLQQRFIVTHADASPVVEILGDDPHEELALGGVRVVIRELRTGAIH